MFIFLKGQNIALEYCDDLEIRCVDLLLQNICSPAPFFLYFDISYHSTIDAILNMTDRNGFQLKHYVHHYDGKALSFNPGLQYPHLHGPVHTPDNNRWDTPPV